MTVGNAIYLPGKNCVLPDPRLDSGAQWSDHGANTGLLCGRDRALLRKTAAVCPVGQIRLGIQRFETHFAPITTDCMPTDGSPFLLENYLHLPRTEERMVGVPSEMAEPFTRTRLTAA